MKYLLDTHTFLWWNEDSSQLSSRAREIIANGKNEIYFSAVSAWEIAIKYAKERLILPQKPDVYIAERMSLYKFQSLAIEIGHSAKVYQLPNHHADPFDRLLIAQSQLESLLLITKNDLINLYDVETIW